MRKRKWLFLLILVFIFLFLLSVIRLPGPFPGIYRAELVTPLEENAQGYLVIKNNQQVYAVSFSSSGRQSILLGKWEKKDGIFVIRCNDKNQTQLMFTARLWGIRWLNPPPEENAFPMTCSFRKLFGNSRIQME